MLRANDLRGDRRLAEDPRPNEGSCQREDVLCQGAAQAVAPFHRELLKDSQGRYLLNEPGDSKGA